MSSLFDPLTLAGVTLKNRIAVSPMCQYSASEGLPTPWHMVHLGSRAVGGAGLVFTEATAVEARGRISPEDTGIWNDAQAERWAPIARFIAEQGAAPGMQLAHAGRKASTAAPWNGGKGLEAGEGGGWRPTFAPSAIAFAPDYPMPQAMSVADIDDVVSAFADATKRAVGAGFQVIEIHGAHGYLLHEFLSPLSNRREDAYGGSLENRMRLPLEVFAAVRAAWPAALPMSVRLSTHDWVEGGIKPADAVEIARAFKAAGADMIDCSSGQVSKDEKPVYGRMYQTPFADRVRNEAGIATIAVGAISEADHVNSIIAAGRADLCAVARPHLANPAWTLTEAARIGWKQVNWPAPYRSAKPQLEAHFQRERAAQGNA